MYRPNHLKARLAAGEKSLGTWLQSAEPTFAEMASIAGFDFIIMDQEHGAGDRQAAVDTMRAASAGPATVIVRVPSSDPTHIRRLVDAGVEGILVPMVETAEQARAIVDCCKYPPRGSRGNAWDITRAVELRLPGRLSRQGRRQPPRHRPDRDRPRGRERRRDRRRRGRRRRLHRPDRPLRQPRPPRPDRRPRGRGRHRPRRRGGEAPPASRSPPSRASARAGSRSSTTASTWSPAAARSSSTARQPAR